VPRRTGMIAPMSERGLPTEGAPACPFVAFVDDRDGRSTAPDHRHRCFAEPRPAPRALAHQEAYCLSSAFPVCPTFQDWARREAAAARPGTAAAAAAGAGAVVAASFADDPAGRPADIAAAPAPLPPSSPQSGSSGGPSRNPPRDWAAPPPWAAEQRSGSGQDPYSAVPYATASAYGSDDWGDPSRGLSGSAADRLAGPDPDVPVPARPAPYDDPDLAMAAGAAGAAAAGSGGRGRPGRRREPAERPQQDPSEVFGPAWERPKRYEAYPTLRTRIGLPAMGGIPKPALAGLGLVLAAVLLFAFGPNLLGLGKGNPGTAAGSPTPHPTEQASASALPTLAPAPTVQVYVVAKNDTMSKIAKRFGLTVAQVMTANPKIKDPNKIKIGDQITIPTPAASDAGGSGASGSPAP
jgi:hypothetical protein